MMSELYDPAFPTGYCISVASFQHAKRDEDDDEDAHKLKSRECGPNSGETFCNDFTEKPSTMVIAESCTEFRKSSECEQYSNNELHKVLMKVTSEKLGLGIKHFNGLLPSIAGRDDYISSCNVKMNHSVQQLEADGNIPVNKDHSYSRANMSENTQDYSADSTDCKFTAMKSEISTVSQININKPLVDCVVDTSLFNGDVNHEVEHHGTVVIETRVPRGTELELSTQAENRDSARGCKEIKNVEIVSPTKVVSVSNISIKETFEKCHALDLSAIDLTDIPLPDTPTSEQVPKPVCRKEGSSKEMIPVPLLHRSVLPRSPLKENLKAKVNNFKPPFSGFELRKKVEVKEYQEQSLDLSKQDTSSGFLDIPLPKTPRPEPTSPARSFAVKEKQEQLLPKTSRPEPTSPARPFVVKEKQEQLLPKTAIPEPTSPARSLVVKDKQEQSSISSVQKPVSSMFGISLPKTPAPKPLVPITSRGKIEFKINFSLSGIKDQTFDLYSGLPEPVSATDKPKKLSQNSSAQEPVLDLHNIPLPEMRVPDLILPIPEVKEFQADRIEEQLPPSEPVSDVRDIPLPEPGLPLSTLKEAEVEHILSSVVKVDETTLPSTVKESESALFLSTVNEVELLSSPSTVKAEPVLSQSTVKEAEPVLSLSTITMNEAELAMPVSTIEEKIELPNNCDVVNFPERADREHGLALTMPKGELILQTIKEEPQESVMQETVFCVTVPELKDEYDHNNIEPIVHQDLSTLNEETGLEIINNVEILTQVPSLPIFTFEGESDNKVKLDMEQSLPLPDISEELDNKDKSSEVTEKECPSPADSSSRRKYRKSGRSFTNDSSSSSPNEEQPVRRSSRIRSLEQKRGKATESVKKGDKKGSKTKQEAKESDIKREEAQNEHDREINSADDRSLLCDEEEMKEATLLVKEELAESADSVGSEVALDCSSRLSPTMDIKREEELTILKPEKVKSRWRRNSELERVSVPVFTVDQAESKNTLPNCKENVIPEESSAAEVPVEKMPHFELIEENIYLFERKRSKSKKEVRRMVCDCAINKEEKELGLFGCGEDCLNRLLMIECGSRCLLGDHCGNKRFQKKLCALTEPFKTKKKGWGLRTIEDLPSGTFVMEYVGEVLSYPDFKQRVKQYAKEKNDHYYFMALKSDEIIDATCKGSMSRFINHSCDPNCETQKWTVNGELRIGFFTNTFVKAGEELTFDYQFERYGREAQKCYCESGNCRGFIGQDKQISLKSNRTVLKKRRALEEKKREDLEDLSLQQEIEKLSGKGRLKNKEDTLLFARLMVRAEETQTRLQLLEIMENTTEPACMRLFLDYHGLPLLWSWMVDVSDSEACELKMKILHVLSLLPITNKTMLLDSKVMNVVQRWALQVEDGQKASKEKDCEQSSSSPPSGATTPGHGDSVENLTAIDGATQPSPSKRSKRDDSLSDSDGGEATPAVGGEDKEQTSKTVEEVSGSDLQDCSAVVLEAESVENAESGGKPAESDVVSTTGVAIEEGKGRTDDVSVKSEEGSREETAEFVEKKVLEVPNLATKLLESWANLKEVFRIPRLEREKRKEDELAAGQQDVEPKRDWEGDARDRYRDRKRGRFRDDNDRDYDRKSSDSKMKRVTLLPTPPLMSKEERRQLFAMEVQQRDHEEALRRQQEEFEMSLLEEQQNVAAALLMQQPQVIMMEYPPHSQEMVLLEYPPYQIDPAAFQQPPSYELVEPQIYDPSGFVTSVPPDAQIIPVPMASSPAVQVTSPLDGQALMPPPSTYVDVGVPSIPLPQTVHAPFSDHNQTSNPHVFQQSPVGMVFSTPPPPQVPYVTTSMSAEAILSPAFPSSQPINSSPTPIPTVTTPLTPPVTSVLPSVKTPAPVSSVLSPATPALSPYVTHQGTPLYYVQNANAVVPLSDQALAMHGNLPLVHVSVAQAPSAEESVVPSPPKSKPTKLPMFWKTAKDEEGNVYYYHSITRQTQWDPPPCNVDEANEDMDLGTPTFDEPKVHKNVASTRGCRSSSRKRHSKKKTTTAAADTSSEVAKKIKELFRTRMSSYIVQCLNPFRKPDCRLGRITCTEDFKHLARKLTHFVMSKELKHCKNVEDLECNENVKHKAKDFVHKYMSRYGSTYKKDKASPKSL